MVTKDRDPGGQTATDSRSEPHPVLGQDAVLRIETDAREICWTGPMLQGVEDSCIECTLYTEYSEYYIHM